MRRIEKLSAEPDDFDWPFVSLPSCKSGSSPFVCNIYEALLLVTLSKETPLVGKRR